MQKILINQWIPDEVASRYKDRYALEYPAKEKIRYTQDEFVAKAHGCEGILVVTAPGDRRLIDAGTHLKAIANLGVGYNNIDVDYAGEKGVYAINTPTTVTHPTAELTLALIIGISRGIVYFDSYTRRVKDTSLPTFGLPITEVASTPHGKTLGIVGFGRIGKQVAKKCKAAFDMKVIYCDAVRADTAVEEEIGATMVSFEELLQTADYVSLHCPYTPENHHLMNKKAFSSMKPSAYFINAARGAIMDEAALVEALTEKRIKGAALDVYEDEPKINPALLPMENVILVPHIGTYTYEVRMQMAVEALDGITAVLEGKVPTNVVNLASFKK
jgi:lactate dehydrogenase-like 2-hydroxyacid dehydrogenase